MLSLLIINNIETGEKMNKIKAYLALSIIPIMLISGCFGVKTENDKGNWGFDTTMNSQANEKVKKGTFELRNEGPIELEVGTVIDENNISDYVISDRYDDIEIDNSNALDPNDARTKSVNLSFMCSYTFNKLAEDGSVKNSLVLEYTWVDKIPPTCDSEDAYWYRYMVVEDEDGIAIAHTNLYLDSLGFFKELFIGDRVFKIHDNYAYYVYKVEIDGIELWDETELIENEHQRLVGEKIGVRGRNEHLDSFETSLLVLLVQQPVYNFNHDDLDLKNLIFKNDPGDHVVTLEVTDFGNNRETFDFKLHIVDDISDEDKQYLLDKGFTQEDIDKFEQEEKDFLNESISYRYKME